MSVEPVGPSAEADESVEAAQRIAVAASAARQDYEQVRGQHEDFARSVSNVLADCLKRAEIDVSSITHRAKSLESFEKKAASPSATNPAEAKYSDPFREITDKAGVRVITYFQSTVQRVSDIIAAQFSVLERVEKVSLEPDRLGYQSIHYLVKLSDARRGLPEYSPYADMIAEIQVRTILQHAWAEIEHDIQYKAIGTLPMAVRRRFTALAGLIEIADREFQAIQDEDARIKAEARTKVDLGQLDQVEITQDSLSQYLDRKLGPDGRMKDWGYRSTARVLLQLGFKNLAEVEECISPYNDEAASRTVFGSKQGQLTRFDLVLLAGMGEEFIRRHPWNRPDNRWFVVSSQEHLEKLKTNGFPVGSYRPPSVLAEGKDPLVDSDLDGALG